MHVPKPKLIVDATIQVEIHLWCWDSKNTSVTVITRWTVPAWLLVCLFPDTWFIATIFNFMCSTYMIFVMIFLKHCNMMVLGCTSAAAAVAVAAWFAQWLLSDAALQNNNYRSEQIFYPTVSAKSAFFLIYCLAFCSWFHLQDMLLSLWCSTSWHAEDVCVWT